MAKDKLYPITIRISASELRMLEAATKSSLGKRSVVARHFLVAALQEQIPNGTPNSLSITPTTEMASQVTVTAPENGTPNSPTITDSHETQKKRVPRTPKTVVVSESSDGTEVALPPTTLYCNLSLSPSKPKLPNSTKPPKRARAREDDPMGFGYSMKGLDQLVELWGKYKPFCMLSLEKRRARAQIMLEKWPGVDHHALTLGAAVWWEDCGGKAVKGKRKGKPVENIAAWIYNQWPIQLEHEAKRQNRIDIDAERARKQEERVKVIAEVDHSQYYYPGEEEEPAT